MWFSTVRNTTSTEGSGLTIFSSFFHNLLAKVLQSCILHSALWLSEAFWYSWVVMTSWNSFTLLISRIFRSFHLLCIFTGSSIFGSKLIFSTSALLTLRGSTVYSWSLSILVNSFSITVSCIIDDFSSCISSLFWYASCILCFSPFCHLIDDIFKFYFYNLYYKFNLLKSL